MAEVRRYAAWLSATDSPHPNSALWADARALLSLVLVSLSELESSLSRRAHCSLLTRIHYRFLVPRASVDDAADYVRFRLAAAGTDPAFFPDNALGSLRELSQGALREIDRLASAALREAA
jgi:type II secretory pathway predicted ATPase ExeA